MEWLTDLIGNDTRKIIATVPLALGTLLALTGAVGILRLPDFYSRLHPAGKADTLAQTFILLGLIIYPEVFKYEDITLGMKLLMVTVLLYITSPTASHAITQAAYLSGLQPWSKDSKSTNNSEESKNA